MARILVIDDEKIIREKLKSLLELDGHQAFTACDGKEGLKLIQEEAPDIALVDIKMPGMNGIEVLKEIRTRTKATEVINITGHGEIDNAIEAMKEGAFGYIRKPIDYDELEIEIKKALKNQEIKKQEIKKKQQQLDEYVHNLEEANEEKEEALRWRKEVEKQNLRQNIVLNAINTIEGDVGS